MISERESRVEAAASTLTSQFSPLNSRPGPRRLPRATGSRRGSSLGIVLALATLSRAAAATTIEQYSLRRIDNTIEIDFAVRGRAPRWQLSSHGQQLWLDLDHSRIAAPIEPTSVWALFPLAGVSMHDFGGGHARLVIRVRGKIDYVVAHMPHELVVRIAPSGQNTDLVQPLLAEMERKRPRSPSFAPAPSPAGERPSRVANNTFTDDNPTGAPIGESTQVPNQTPAAESATSVAAPPRAAATVYGDQPVGQAFQPVTQQIAVAPQPDGARPVVVIDAGHGGPDPGTESAGGIAEKTVALTIARRLEMALEARGVSAELTRSDDAFLSLAERTELANHAHADLFVSIHLNSSPDLSATGIETYYLNNTTDRATIRLARNENGGGYGAHGQSNLNYILTNLQQDYKANESASLARLIEVESTASIDTTLSIRVNALGAKMGPFYVLVGAEMPSVLVECGFLSNPQEAQRLTQPRYQQALAEGIALAVVHYFNADAAVGNL